MKKKLWKRLWHWLERVRNDRQRNRQDRPGDFGAGQYGGGQAEVVLCSMTEV